MSQTVADILVKTLEQIGVKQIFGLIGDSLNPLGDSVRRSELQWIGVRHEEGAALAAAGQAKLTGQIAVCAGTTGPGSTHLVAGLYEAARDHAPVLAISGEMDRKMQGIDFIQTTAPDLLFRDVSVYTQTITTAEQAPAIIHQAIAAAYAHRGVAHLTIPDDVMRLSVEQAYTSIDTLKPRSEITPSDADVKKIAQKIDAANKIVILCGAGCHGLGETLRTLSDRLKAPLAHTVKGKDIMAYDDPHWMGGLGMIGTKPVYDSIMNCDLLLMLGTDYPYSEFLPHVAKTIQIDERAEVLGRRTPTQIGLMASVKPTIERLLALVQAKSDASFFHEVAEQRKKWDEMLDKQASIKRSDHCIHPQAVARMVSDLAADDAIFVLDTGLNTVWSGNWIRQRGKQRILGSFNNAAVGTAVGQANGIQAIRPFQPVIAMCGDGGFNMLMCEFLTATQHKLPIKVIIYNNSSLALIGLEAEATGLPAFRQAIDYPNPDYAAFAKACGGFGISVTKPDQLENAIRQAFATKGPAIVDVAIAANELPNMPHKDFKKIGHFGIAKIREWLDNRAPSQDKAR